MSSDLKQTTSQLTEDEMAMLDADVESARDAWKLPTDEQLRDWLNEHQPKRWNIWQKAAKSGHSGAQWPVDLCFREGFGIKQNELRESTR